MFLAKFCCSRVISYACKSVEGLLHRSVLNQPAQRHISLTDTNLIRIPKRKVKTLWSKIRPRNTFRGMHIPKRLLDGKYYRNMGKSGRGHDGRILLRHIGGGRQRNWRIVEKCRAPLLSPGEEPFVFKDRITQIGYDPFRSGDLATVVGNGSLKVRLMLAPHDVVVGDILTASRGPPASIARMKPGDAHPLRFLPPGTMVHNIELEPGGGGKICCAGGTSATIVRKSEKQVYLKTKSKKRNHIIAHLDAMATIGMVSCPVEVGQIIGKAGRSRWLNRKPKGLTGKDRWHNRKKKGGSQPTGVTKAKNRAQKSGKAGGAKGAKK